jgi:hypothetical protein
MSGSTKEKEAELYYNYYLNKKVYPLIGDKTTYLTELLGASKKLFGVKFKGVYPCDKIPKLNDLAPYCILNLDSSKEKGSHWIALAKSNNETLVYDSFGRDYKKIIPNLNYSGNGRIKNTDKDAEQKILATDCGARCIAFLMVFDKHGKDTAMLI